MAAGGDLVLLESGDCFRLDLDVVGVGVVSRQQRRRTDPAGEPKGLYGSVADRSILRAPSTSGSSPDYVPS